MTYKNFLFALFALVGIISKTAHGGTSMTRTALTETKGLIARAAQTIKTHPKLACTIAVAHGARCVYGIYRYNKPQRYANRLIDELNRMAPTDQEARAAKEAEIATARQALVAAEGVDAQYKGCLMQEEIARKSTHETLNYIRNKFRRRKSQHSHPPKTTTLAIGLSTCLGVTALTAAAITTTGAVGLYLWAKKSNMLDKAPRYKKFGINALKIEGILFGTADLFAGFAYAKEWCDARDHAAETVLKRSRSA
jgi:hypothetical protein